MTVFKSILNEQTACLLLYGEISDEGGDGKIASRDIVNELMYLDGAYENLNIRINSIGGDAIYIDGDIALALADGVEDGDAGVNIAADGVDPDVQVLIGSIQVHQFPGCCL